jgi:outer membrane protein, multidrug efflux system
MPPQLRPSLALAAALLTAACAPTVHIPAPDTHLPAAFEAPAATAGQPLSLDRWWEDFHDPQMRDLVVTALSRSTTIRLAYERLAEARAQRAQTRAGTRPSGNLTLSANEQGENPVWGYGGSSAPETFYEASAYPSWDLDLFGRLAAIRRKADLDRDASAMDFEGTRLALTADVASALVQARYLAVQLADARDSQRISRDLAESGTLGRMHGLTAGQDADRLIADAESDDAEVARLTGELRAAKRLLLIQIGEPAASTDTLAIEARLPDAPPLPAVTPGALLARRPDLRSSELSLRSAAVQVQVDRRALFPDFNLQPGTNGLEVLATAGATGGATGIWSLAAGMTVPILDRARLIGTMRISEARGREAVVNYETAVQTAFGEAENALTRIAADRRRVASLERAAQAAESSFAGARLGYTNGLTDLTTLLQAERIRVQDRAALDAARTALLSDTIAAIRALGGGWTPAPSSPAPEPR